MYPIYHTVLPSPEGTPSPTNLQPTLSTTPRPKVVNILPKPIQVPFQYQPQMIINHPQQIMFTGAQPIGNVVNVPVQQFVRSPSISPGPQVISTRFVQSNQRPVVCSQNIPSSASGLKKVIRSYPFPINKPASGSRVNTPTQKVCYVGSSTAQVKTNQPVLATNAVKQKIVKIPQLSNEQLKAIFFNSTIELGGSTITPKSAQTVTLNTNFKRPKVNQTITKSKVQKLSNINSVKSSSNESTTSPTSVKRINAYEENLYSTLGLLPSTDVEIEDHNSELNPSFLETNQTEHANNDLASNDTSDASILMQTNPSFLETSPSEQSNNSQTIDTSDTRMLVQTNSAFLETSQSGQTNNSQTIDTSVLVQMNSSFSETSLSGQTNNSQTIDNSDTSMLVQTELINELLQSILNPALNVKDSTPIPRLCQEREMDFTIPPHVKSVILELRIQINSCLERDSWEQIPIHQAVKEHDWKTLESYCIILKAIKSHLDHVNNNHETALLLAVLEQERIGEGVCEGVTILLAEGASQRIPDAQGCYTLHHAVRMANVDLLKVLLAADNVEFVINRCNNDGLTPLHVAAANNLTVIIQLLASYGVDLSLKDRKCGRTAFYIACEKGHLESATVLLSLGASTSDLNYTGEPPPEIQQPPPMNQLPLSEIQQTLPMNQQPLLMNEQPPPMKQQPPSKIGQPPFMNLQPPPSEIQQTSPMNQQPLLMNQQPPPMIQHPPSEIHRPPHVIQQPPSEIRQQPLVMQQSPSIDQKKSNSPTGIRNKRKTSPQKENSEESVGVSKRLKKSHSPTTSQVPDELSIVPNASQELSKGSTEATTVNCNSNKQLRERSQRLSVRNQTNTNHSQKPNQSLNETKERVVVFKPNKTVIVPTVKTIKNTKGGVNLQNEKTVSASNEIGGSNLNNTVLTPGSNSDRSCGEDSGQTLDCIFEKKSGLETYQVSFNSYFESLVDSKCKKSVNTVNKNKVSNPTAKDKSDNKHDPKSKAKTRRRRK